MMVKLIFYQAYVFCTKGVQGGNRSVNIRNNFIAGSRGTTLTNALLAQPQMPDAKVGHREIRYFRKYFFLNF